MSLTVQVWENTYNGLNIDMEVEFMNQHATKYYLPTFFLPEKLQKLSCTLLTESSVLD